MNFDRLEYLPGILLGGFTFVVLTILLEKRYFRLVKTYWFYRRSVISALGSILYLVGMGGLLFALLDLRGPEERIKTEMFSDRTIILIDTSASMLAEDVKPSRLQKAVLIAKHFARKAGGHQISIVAFAEIQKKIVPFTNDLDLIDSRLESLKNLRNHYGSSALRTALQESIQYFKEAGDGETGNLVVITDGEETAEGFDLNIPKGIRVALVGVGTKQGGRIPLDDGRGFRFGYKKDRGQDVITKLNEKFFEVAVNDISTAKHWIASSYTLPSEEILDFFISEKKKGQGQQDMVIKPVLMEYVVVPALLLILLSYLFKAIRIFAVGLLLIISPSWSQEKEKEIKLRPEVIESMGRLQRGELDRVERLKLADEMYKGGLKPEGMTLFKENLGNAKVDKDLPPEAYLNYGTAQLENGDTVGGLKTYQRLLDSIEGSPQGNQIKSMIEKNIVTHFRQQEQKKEQDQQQKSQQNDENKDQKDQQNQPQQKQGQDGQQQDKKQGQKNQEQKKDTNQENKDKQDKRQENKDENKDEKDQDQDKDKENKGENQQEKNLPPKKLPAKLKQLMSDDRQLQMKIIENGTRDMNKKRSRKSKDW
jgi:Ca-activated chloride channel family protein